jgi:hypothetical protein
MLQSLCNNLIFFVHRPSVFLPLTHFMIRSLLLHKNIPTWIKWKLFSIQWIRLWESLSRFILFNSIKSQRFSYNTCIQPASLLCLSIILVLSHKNHHYFRMLLSLSSSSCKYDKLFLQLRFFSFTQLSRRRKCERSIDFSWFSNSSSIRSRPSIF